MQRCLAGQNPDVVGRSETLSQYAVFVAKVREYEADGLALTEAVNAAVQYCVERGILADYLEQYAAEVLNMLTTEWDMDVALEVRYDEGYHEGCRKRRNEERRMCDLKWETWLHDILTPEQKRKLEAKRAMSE
ncbi:MAG: hypothetical protein LBK75_01215 [Oscillospiraceae bacterium]|nr:hypothetical protein [Oscillospiraceae bacterium]